MINRQTVLCATLLGLGIAIAAMEPFEKTYAMIKPDALRAGKAEEICQLIEVHGFTIIAKQKLQVIPLSDVIDRFGMA